MSKKSNPAKILIADDTPTNLDLLQNMLEKEGHEVRCAPNGEMALQVMRLERPDLVLLDITMPGMDGYEVCQKLKADKPTSEIPIIFISARTDTADKVKGFELGAVDYISKPFIKAEVIARVQTHLNLSRFQSELKRLEQENKENKKHFNEAQQIAHLGSWNWDLKTNLTSWSDEMFNIYGIPKIIPMPYEKWTSRVAPDDLAKAEAMLQRAIDTQQQEKVEFKIIRPDGSFRYIDATIEPIIDENNKTIRVIGANIDITERKEAEIKLREAKEQAVVANRAKSNLMANMSHELRTPLNAIIGFSGSMKEETFGPVGSDKNREYLDDIHYSGQHLLELINDILDLSAFEEGALELSEANVDLPKVAEAAARIIQPRAEHGQVKVTSSLEPGTPLIYADERRVKQVMLNLLSNAVKFTPEGGKVIIDSLLNDDGSFSVFVSDTGYGMNDDEAAIALSKFGQVDSGHDRKHEGTGLGLPLTKGLMELHGGTLEIDSLEGYGTMVTATFPKERVIKNVC